MLEYLIGLCVVVFFVLAWKGYVIGTTHLPQLPYPSHLPFIGQLHIIGVRSQRHLLRWFEENTTPSQPMFGLCLPFGPQAVYISQAADIEFVLKGAFIKDKFFTERSNDVFGRGIINSEGEEWAIQRKVGVRFLHRKLPFFTTTFASKIQPIVEILRSAAKNNTVVDFQELMQSFTMAVFAELAFSTEVPQEVADAFDKSIANVYTRFKNPFYKLTERFTPSIQANIRTLKNFSHNLVKTRMNESIAGDKKDDLLDGLMEMSDDVEFLADACMNYLSAARDTTAQSFTWTFYLLLRNPTHLNTLLASIPKDKNTSDNTLNKPDNTHETNPTNPNKQSKDINSTLPNNTKYTFETLLEMDFAKAVFLEAVRTRSPVPFEMKEATQACVLPCGVHVPRGCVVVWSPYVCGRSFGPFNPAAPPKTTPYSSPVFNAGPRACVGQNFAVLEGVFVLCTLLEEFDFRLTTDEERFMQNSLTMPMENGLPLFVTKRGQ
eukprot:Phypoly_transcript_06148.p1 GENE.Phypoly_transcript_06148~~Phypoly_transcript_06148.p1  ORF type:complete len:491 (+),score=74.65 Phypoly_transcript_06148:55-1527(+)